MASTPSGIRGTSDNIPEDQEIHPVTPGATRAGVSAVAGPTRPWPAERVELWPIERLIPYADNPRLHSAADIERIAASILKWGWTNPVLVDEQGVLIAGHCGGRAIAVRPDCEATFARCLVRATPTEIGSPSSVRTRRRMTFAISGGGPKRWMHPATSAKASSIEIRSTRGVKSPNTFIAASSSRW